MEGAAAAAFTWLVRPIADASPSWPACFSRESAGPGLAAAEVSRQLPR